MSATIRCGLCGATYTDWTKADTQHPKCPKDPRHPSFGFMSASTDYIPPKYTPMPFEIRAGAAAIDFSKQIDRARRNEARRLLADQIFTS